MKILSLLTKRGRLRFKRYRKIFSTLVSHGFDEIAYQTGVGRLLQLVRWPFGEVQRRKGRAVMESSTWERIRLVAEELGPTYIKLGQILSNRPDLIPGELQRELEKLQENVPPFAHEQAVQIVESELGRPVGEIFAQFDTEPQAAASMAQIHRAVLKSGEVAAIKIQRPGLAELVEIDIDILHELAELIDRYVPQSRNIGPREIVHKFEKAMHQELDFRREVAAIERFGKQFAKEEGLKVPQVYRELCTRKVLCMEFIQGRPLADLLEHVQQDPEQGKCIARLGAELTLKQIFHYGFFHADPHPGNIVVMEDGRICYIDFGLTGSLVQRDLETVGNMITSIISRNEQTASRAVIRLAGSRDFETARSIERDIAEIIERFQGSEGDFSFTALLSELVQILVHKGLRLPPDLFLLVKSLITIEGVASALDPQFDFTAHLKPFAETLVKDRFDPQRIKKNLSTMAGDYAELLQSIPADYYKLVDTISAGKVRLSIEEKSLKPLNQSLLKASSTLAFALVLMALIIGSSLIVHARVPPLWNQVSAIGIVGFLLSGVIGFWLLVKIIRNGGL